MRGLFFAAAVQFSPAVVYLSRGEYAHAVPYALLAAAFLAIGFAHRP